MDRLALILMIIGSVAWGIYGLFYPFNLVESIFGAASIISRAIFVLVGAAGIYSISLLFRERRPAK
jgi:uncharacterized membrane protein YuzA (DUF378 family)